MRNGTLQPTLADLIRLDWAIVEQGKLVRMTKRSIADLSAACVDTSEQVKALATLQHALNGLNLDREAVRKALLNPE